MSVSDRNKANVADFSSHITFTCTNADSAVVLLQSFLRKMTKSFFLLVLNAEDYNIIGLRVDAAVIENYKSIQ